MRSSLVMDYIRQQCREMGATGFHFEETAVLIIGSGTPVFRELEPNQRLYVPLFDMVFNTSAPQNLGPADFAVKVSSPTAELVFTKGQFLPHGFDVLVMNGNEHSGKVSFSYEDNIGLPGDGLAVQVIIVDYHLPSGPPCPQPSTSC